MLKRLSNTVNQPWMRNLDRLAILMGIVVLIVFLFTTLVHADSTRIALASVNITSWQVISPSAISITTTAGTFNVSISSPSQYFVGVTPTVSQLDTQVYKWGATLQFLTGVTQSNFVNYSITFQSNYNLTVPQQTKEIIQRVYQTFCDNDTSFNTTYCYQRETGRYRVNQTFVTPEIDVNTFVMEMRAFQQASDSFLFTQTNHTYNFTFIVNTSSLDIQGSRRQLAIDPSFYASGIIWVNDYKNLSSLNETIKNNNFLRCYGRNSTGLWCYVNAHIYINSTGWLNLTNNNLSMNESSSGQYRIINYGNFTATNGRINSSNVNFAWSYSAIQYDPVSFKIVSTNQKTIVTNSYFDRAGYDDSLEYQFGIYTMANTTYVNTTFNNTAAVFLDGDRMTLANSSYYDNSVLDASTGFSQYSGINLGYNVYANYNNITGNSFQNINSCGGGCFDTGIAMFGKFNNIVGNVFNNIGGQDTTGGVRYEGADMLAIYSASDGTDSAYNVIENNTFTLCNAEQRSIESGAIYTEGDSNIFRNNLIENNTNNVACSGFVLKGDQNILESNRITGFTQYGIWFDLGNSNNVTQNVLRSTVDNTSNLFFLTDNNYVYLTNSSASKNSAGGGTNPTSAYFSTGSMFNVINNSILNGTSQSASTAQVGIFFAGITESNNSIWNSSIYGQLFGVRSWNNATDNYIYDSFIDSSAGGSNFNIRMDTGDSGRRLTIINTTLVDNRITFPVGTGDYRLYTGWWLSTFTNSTNGTNLSGANLLLYDVSNNLVYNDTTQPTGFAGQAPIIYTWQNKTILVTVGENMTYNATYVTLINTTFVNMSTNRFIVFTFGQLPTIQVVIANILLPTILTMLFVFYFVFETRKEPMVLFIAGFLLIALAPIVFLNGIYCIPSQICYNGMWIATANSTEAFLLFCILFGSGAILAIAANQKKKKNKK